MKKENTQAKCDRYFETTTLVCLLLRFFREKFDDKLNTGTYAKGYFKKLHIMALTDAYFGVLYLGTSHLGKVGKLIYYY